MTSRLGSRLVESADAIPELTVATWLDIAHAGLTVAAALAAIWMVTDVRDSQLAWLEPGSAADLAPSPAVDAEAATSPESTHAR